MLPLGPRTGPLLFERVIARALEFLFSRACIESEIMNFSLFSVRDKKLGVYLAPFVARGDADALRQVRYMLESNQDNPSRDFHFVREPESYALYNVAGFDDESGKVAQLLDGPRLVVEFGQVSAQIKAARLTAAAASGTVPLDVTVPADTTTTPESSDGNPKITS